MRPREPPEAREEATPGHTAGALGRKNTRKYITKFVEKPPSEKIFRFPNGFYSIFSEGVVEYC